MIECATENIFEGRHVNWQAIRQGIYAEVHINGEHDKYV